MKIDKGEYWQNVSQIQDICLCHQEDLNRLKRNINKLYLQLLKPVFSHY